MRPLPSSRILYVVRLFILVMLVFACDEQNPIGPSRRVGVSATGTLAFSPSRLDFGGETTELRLRIKNTRNRGLVWKSRVLDSWVSLPDSGRIEAGDIEAVTVRVSRSKLTPGSYHTSIRFRTDVDVQSVPVTLLVVFASPIDIQISGIDATGKTDVTQELNDFIASIPDGSIIRFPAGARYRIEGVVRLIDRHNLTIEGNGALLFATTDGSGVTPPEDMKHLWPRLRQHVQIKGGNGIVVRNLTVRGANPHAGMETEAYVVGLEGQHAFSISGAVDVELHHVTVTDVYGDFVYISSNGGTWSRDIHIHDSRFERNGRQGIAITGGQGILIERIYIGDTRRATFDLEPHSVNGGAEDVVIRNNEIGPGRLTFVAAAGVGGNVSFTVENNIGHRSLGMLVRTGDPQYRRGPIRVVGNVSDAKAGGPLAHMRFFRVDGVVVQNNVQPFQESREKTYVMICESTGVQVSNNQVPGAGREFETIDPCPTDS